MRSSPCFAYTLDLEHFTIFSRIYHFQNKNVLTKRVIAYRRTFDIQFYHLAHCLKVFFIKAAHSPEKQNNGIDKRIYNKSSRRDLP